MPNLRRMLPFLALLAVIPAAYAVPGNLDDFEETQFYEKNDILHAFDSMQRHITLDENYHLFINITSAKLDPNTSQLDIAIANDFAIYNDMLMDVKVGPVGQTNELDVDYDGQVRYILDDFDNGKFKNLFSEESNFVAKTNEITYTIYNEIDTPILSVFGVDIVPVHHGASGTVCSGGFDDPHLPDSSPTTVTGFTSLHDAQYALYQLDYHRVPEYAIFGGEASRDIDFAKTVTSGAPGDCNDGPFRDQAIINTYTHAEYKVTEDEPNPEVLSYWWPSYWWGFYVEYWHDNF